MRRSWHNLQENEATLRSFARKKVREATSNNPADPSFRIMNEIAQLTFNVEAFSEIMQIVWERLNNSGLDWHWRHVYKTLVLLEYLIKTGSAEVREQCKNNISSILILKNFQYLELDTLGKYSDVGEHVREKAIELINLLETKQRLPQGASGLDSIGMRRDSDELEVNLDDLEVDLDEAFPCQVRIRSSAFFEPHMESSEVNQCMDQGQHVLEKEEPTMNERFAPSSSILRSEPHLNTWGPNCIVHGLPGSDWNSSSESHLPREIENAWPQTADEKERELLLDYMISQILKLKEQIAQGTSSFGSDTLVETEPNEVAAQNNGHKTNAEADAVGPVDPADQIQNISLMEAAAQPHVTKAKECAICLNKPPEFAFVPCGHKCVCPECSKEFLKRQIVTCPLCRSYSDRVMQIFD